MRNTADGPSRELCLRQGRAWRRVALARLRRMTLHLLASEPWQRPGDPPLNWALGVFLVNARRIARLNEAFLGHSGPTDVITFPYGPPPGAAPGSRWLCGEVFICLHVAEQQARTFRTTWPREVARYLIHGLLHLAGFDDQEPAARRAMKLAERQALRRLARKFRLETLAIRRG